MSSAPLVGNSRLKAALFRSNLTSVILDGPIGSGKKTAAREIAAALFCKQPDPPCGECGQCVRLRVGSHPDFEILNENGEGYTIDDIRALRKRSYIAPSEAPFKIFVLCGADSMREQQQNVLLKTLEEPASAYFILLTENSQSLLATVRSRCMVYRMEPLPQETIEKQLMLKRPGASKSAVKAAAETCEGVLGRALDILDNGGNKLAAQAFELCAALKKGELALMEKCLEAGKLTREEYFELCGYLCSKLTAMAAETGDARYIRFGDAVNAQIDTQLLNPSPKLLSAALAASWGKIIDR